MKRLIIAVVLLFAVAVSADNKKTEVQLLQGRVEFLQGKLTMCIGKLALEYGSTVRGLQQVPTPQVDKEKKDKKKKKGGK